MSSTDSKCQLSIVDMLLNDSAALDVFDKSGSAVAAAAAATDTDDSEVSLSWPTVCSDDACSTCGDFGSGRSMGPPTGRGGVLSASAYVVVTAARHPVVCDYRVSNVSLVFHRKSLGIWRTTIF